MQLRVLFVKLASGVESPSRLEHDELVHEGAQRLVGRSRDDRSRKYKLPERSFAKAKYSCLYFEAGCDAIVNEYDSPVEEQRESLAIAIELGALLNVR